MDKAKRDELRNAWKYYPPIATAVTCGIARELLDALDAADAKIESLNEQCYVYKTTYERTRTTLAESRRAALEEAADWLYERAKEVK